ncbi:hypothetical protein HPB52_006760 [Rhipicephalus sanguineus]|uniref:ATP-dependent DNA helicase n=1 Tax=Rhipicephalus sanguineus TaxID=34632 RepID=A0A9D4SMI9_RHISA|nr:hypothetical protein HPB52_006760 [Rhipicephalus sanguineus]
MENPCVQISPVTITGTVTVEHLQSNGAPARKVTHQNAEAALYRNEFRDILLRARLGPRSVVYSLQNAVVHKKFVREGVGTGTATVEVMMQRAMRPPWVNHWRRCKVLVVDEVSMLDGRFFHKLERVARLVRRNDRPFGGIQLVLCGDFLQLPPCINITLELKQVHRQSDPRFISLLQQVRVGSCPDWVEEVLKKTASRCLDTGDIVATRLSTHTDDVDFINQRCFDQLPSTPRIFKAIDSEGASADLLEVCAPSTLSLKVGTQVMLTKNTQVKAGLANGSRGVVVGFDSASGDPIVQFMNSCKQTITKERWAIRTGAEDS